MTRPLENKKRAEGKSGRIIISAEEKATSTLSIEALQKEGTPLSTGQKAGRQKPGPLICGKRFRSDQQTSAKTTNREK